MNGIVYAFIGTLFTFLVTTLGACNVFFIRKNMNQNLQCLFLGFAGGVMVAASIWSLLLPGIEEAQENNQISWLPHSECPPGGQRFRWPPSRLFSARSMPLVHCSHKVLFFGVR